MATEILLDVEPQQLKFPYVLNEQVSCSIRLSNRTQLHVAFKVMTTSPERYSLLPKSGTVLPGSSCNILVTKAPLLAVQPGDKFLIKSVVASSYITDENIIQDLFTVKAGYLVQNSIHEVIYTSPSQIPSPVADILSSSDASRAMGTTKFLDIHPVELQFPFELNKELSCQLQLSNMTKNHVIFKVKTTDPKKYAVMPNCGVVKPQSTCDVIVMMQAQAEIPLDRLCKDKFLIQSVVGSSAATTEQITSEMFNETGCFVDELKLRAVYSFPSHSKSPKHVESEVDASPEAPSLQDRSLNDPQMGTTKLLDIHPVELQFPFELNKELPCQLQLSNMTKNHVIFKVKTTDPKKYAVMPNCGVVKPQSTCDVIVMMRAQTEIPLDRLCKDKFLIQSIVGSSAATTEQITSEMFNETGCFVDELKLRAVYSFPSDSQSSKYAESEVDSSPEAPSLRVRSLNDPQVVQRLDRKECTFWDFFWNTVIVGILCFMFWHLMVKTLPFVWSLTFAVIMLVGKVVRSLVTNSVDELIVNTLGYVFVHFITVLFRRLANRSET